MKKQETDKAVKLEQANTMATHEKPAIVASSIFHNVMKASVNVTSKQKKKASKKST